MALIVTVELSCSIAGWKKTTYVRNKGFRQCYCTYSTSERYSLEGHLKVWRLFYGVFFHFVSCTCTPTAETCSSTGVANQPSLYIYLHNIMFGNILQTKDCKQCSQNMYYVFLSSILVTKVLNVTASASLGSTVGGQISVMGGIKPNQTKMRERKMY
jgi:hypothetical protein